MAQKAIFSENQTTNINKKDENSTTSSKKNFLYQTWNKNEPTDNEFLPKKHSLKNSDKTPGKSTN